MKVLRSFPWLRVEVDAWMVESNKLDRGHLLRFMKSKRYRCYHFDQINTFCKRASTSRAARRPGWLSLLEA